MASQSASDPRLPSEARHPACFLLSSLQPAQGSQPLCVELSTSPPGPQPVPRSKVWMWKECWAGILPFAGWVTLGTSLSPGPDFTSSARGIKHNQVMQVPHSPPSLSSPTCLIFSG